MPECIPGNLDRFGFVLVLNTFVFIPVAVTLNHPHPKEAKA